MGILQLIANSNFITVNKDLIKLLGLEEAILIGELASEYEYWEKQGKLENGYFYSTIENIEENTTLSEFKQRKALNKLKQFELIEITVKGIPAKRYIKINEEKLLELFQIKFLKNSGTVPLKIQELEPKKLKGNNNIINSYINNNNNKEIYKEIYKEKFEKFYSLYPRKVGKVKVEDWFKRNNPNEELFNNIIHGLEAYNIKWSKDKTDKKYIPHPTSWLNAKRWEDEIDTSLEELKNSEGSDEDGRWNW